jgi:hypothetical protein
MPQPGRPPASRPAGSQPPITTGPYGTFGQYPTGPYAGTTTTPTSAVPGQPTPGGAMDPSAGQPRPDLSHLDYSNDPILGRIRALAEESIGQAQADATAARTRLVIGLGDPELASKLGLGNKIRSQAEGNTFGTFQELSRQLQRRNTFDITGRMSDEGNLFYSTARTRALGLSGEQYLRDKSQATSAAQGTLADISSRMTQARMAAQAQIISAEQDAYNRALQQALYGY